MERLHDSLILGAAKGLCFFGILSRYCGLRIASYTRQNLLHALVDLGTYDRDVAPDLCVPLTCSALLPASPEFDKLRVSSRRQDTIHTS